MKKVLVLLVVAVLGSSLGFAQSSQSHDVNVKIPSVLRIRITSGASNAPVTAPSAVVFDFVANPTLFEVGTPLASTNAAPANWDGIKVFSNGQAWRVEVATTTTGAFDWSKVSVLALDGSPLFNLGSGEIATGGITSGWMSLGFGPSDFRITFDGSEDAGTYDTTVTYNIYSN